FGSAWALRCAGLPVARGSAPGELPGFSHAFTAPPLPRAKSLPVRPGSAPIGNGGVRPDGSRRSPPEYLVSTSGSDQTTGRSAGEIHPSASAPTSAPSDSPCSGSEVSSATLL